MKLINIVAVSVFLMSIPLSGCPTCLGFKETMYGKSQLYKALNGMKVNKQKQLVQLVHRLNHARVGSTKQF